MRERIDWNPSDTIPDPGEVLLLQGIPAGVEPPRRVLAILEEASAAYLDTAEPRALVADISKEAFARVYRGEGRNAPVSPIEAVVEKADALALFVATCGGSVTERIRTLFAQNEPALAAMLDSVASAAADGLTSLLAARRRAHVDGGAESRGLTLGYSPGYCGWHVSGQRALFEFLGTGPIGVTLNESCLMDPLKSVSGVLADGPADIHQFAPGYEFCADCRTKPCLSRIRPSPGRGSGR